MCKTNVYAQWQPTKYNILSYKSQQTEKILKIVWSELWCPKQLETTNPCCGFFNDEQWELMTVLLRTILARNNRLFFDIKNNGRK